MDYAIKKVTIDDYDAIYELWNATEQSRRALNPVDDSREGIARYLKRNPDTCFAMPLRTVECRRSGSDIMKAMTSQSASRRNAGLSINGGQRMWMCL
ncbi:MAG: hypothetical protein IJ608_11990 [Lachnospiraceae bacterium]|nr:hypothetical protein [Lachnospiraceae bacterium]